LSYPYIYFKNITDNQHKNIVIKERVHNGTAYNGEVDHILSLNRQMKLTQVLCIESKLIDPNNGCIINRSLKKGVLICELKCKQKKPQLIGEVGLKLKPDVKIISKKAFIPEYSSVLITGSNVNEKKFLIYGTKSVWIDITYAPVSFQFVGNIAEAFSFNFSWKLKPRLPGVGNSR